VAIIAQDEIRHRRAKKRGRIDDSSDEAFILKRDEREKEWGIEQVINQADITIQNESSLDEFQQKITNLFSKEFRDESID
jgi:dephospho-CoA kinase